MSDATENIAFRYCGKCYAMLEPDTTGPCECSPRVSALEAAQAASRESK